MPRGTYISSDSIVNSFKGGISSPLYGLIIGLLFVVIDKIFEILQVLYPSGSYMINLNVGILFISVTLIETIDLLMNFVVAILSPFSAIALMLGEIASLILITSIQPVGLLSEVLQNVYSSCLLDMAVILAGLIVGCVLRYVS